MQGLRIAWRRKERCFILRQNTAHCYWFNRSRISCTSCRLNPVSFAIWFSVCFFWNKFAKTLFDDTGRINNLFHFFQIGNFKKSSLRLSANQNFSCHFLDTSDHTKSNVKRVLKSVLHYIDFMFINILTILSTLSIYWSIYFLL